MTPEQASVIAEFLLPQVEHEVATTVRVLSAVPDDQKSYCPSDRCMNAGTLAEHIVGSDLWFLDSIVKGEFGPFPEATNKPVAELVEDYQSKSAAYLDQIRQLPAEHMAKEVQFYMFNMPLVTYLQFMQKHSVHHRGQLTAYLRPMGAKVPSIYGGSADEPVAATA